MTPEGENIEVAYAKISKNIWKKSESKIKMSTENETSVLVLIFTPFIQK